jgi:hypothetical protein
LWSTYRRRIVRKIWTQSRSVIPRPPGTLSVLPFHLINHILSFVYP